ncbi:sigma-70 family RNA polymerase sigma factor [Spirochaetes bacterium]|uniref:Sigma-70 family RNA polymerase sigma factor n=1 Tax=Candidatus Scatousia excrementipullorum TaxID=2840936 RepID=A0A9D9H027_9BACT|nr:sigma-70 family RNA polymerase sigma factor [Candidatus Scatousia excrementipullorum]
MQNNSNKLKEYIDLVQKVARVEYRRIPAHMVEYEELLSIGIIAIQALIKNKSMEQLARYNSAYIATAVRWAIRNELRIRYKWYSLKHKTDEDEDVVAEDDEATQKSKVREAIYETVLSIDGLADAASDNDSPFDFLKDKHATPDENAEISEMGRMIREAISKLPPKDRTVVEYRFYRNMQVKDIARQVGLSSSRVTRIVQAALNTIKEYLNQKEQYGY